MTLTPGTRIGPYEVIAQIGVGGMGEVYRATDTNLKRAVAIKVLPESVASDAERLARFQREAEVLASLNHPNIAAIYGLERSGGTTALVMELVEGPTLAEIVAGSKLSAMGSSHRSSRPAEGPGPRAQSRYALPLDEALPIAKQIADALEAAHEKGIIHRDLKPANVKVRPDGMVKVLDFGLAKLTQGKGEGGGGKGDLALSQSPTITTPAMTQMGMILGTAAYMSPEQARGKLVDKRADIWAFGCVLYEMLSGTRPFDGEDMTEVLGAVVRLEPDWDALPSDVPPLVRTLLQSCLVKDPRHRVADISTARFVIDEVGRVPRPSAGSGRPEHAEGRSGPADPDPAVVQQQLQQQTEAAVAAVRRVLARSMRRRVTLVGAAALITGLVIAGAAVWSAMRPVPPPALPETRTEISTPATDDPISFALSPDGRQIIFVASGDGASRLWLRSLAATTAQPLAGTEGALFPFWSPDSRSVGFFADGTLKRLDIGGGQPQILAAAAAPRGGTWNADGVVLFARSTVGPLFRASASGGEAIALTTLDRQSSHRFPSFLPDGRQFLFSAQGTPETSGIYLGSLDSGEGRRLTAADTAGVYVPSGWLVWVRSGTLVAQRLDLARSALAGNPVTLADRVAFDANYGVGAVSATATALAYRPGGASRRQLAWFDRSGKALGTLGAPDDNDLLGARLSPDHRQVAVVRTVQGNSDIWLLDGSRTSRFTFDAALDRWPVWSPDGSRIVFDSARQGTRNLYTKPSNGTGTEQLLMESSQIKIATDWSADGRFLLYQSNEPQTDWDLWVLPLEGDRLSTRSASSGSTVSAVEPSTGSGRPEPAEGRKPWAFLSTNFSERYAQFSPDGRWVAYMSNESGRMEVYIRPFVEPSATGAGMSTGGQWQVSTAGGIYPRWRPDGRELYYIGPDGRMIAAPIAATSATLKPGTPVTLFQTGIYGGGAEIGQGRQYDVARDGRFLINTVLDAAAAPITLLQNWNPESKP